MKHLSLVISLLLSGLLRGQEPSALIFEDNEGCLRYTTDTEGNHLPDFSHAGYRGGFEAVPSLPAVMTISAIPGDNTDHIQNALDQVGQLPLDANGHRGALLLAPAYTKFMAP